MTVPTLAVLATLTLAMASTPGYAAPSGSDPLASYRWKARVLLVLAPDAADGRLQRQKNIFRAMQAGADERDLTVVEVLGDSGQALALRDRFDLGSGFKAILIGKDGGDKLISDEPLGPDQLFPLIDSMPMRQGEMRKK